MEVEAVVYLFVSLFTLNPSELCHGTDTVVKTTDIVPPGIDLIFQWG